MIDLHTHYTPPELATGTADSAATLEMVGGVPAYTHHRGLSDLGMRLEVMDAVGIDTAYLSSGAGLHAALGSCRRLNDALARCASDHPGRLEGLAHVPDPTTAESLRELERATRDLGFKGVAVASTTAGGHGLDAPRLEDFYSYLEENDVFLFVHPALGEPSMGLQGFDRYDLYRSVGREFDLQLALLRLIIGGVLDRHPRLRAVISHLGGGIAAVWPRIRHFQNKEFFGVAGGGIHGQTAERPIDEYLDRLLFDTGGFFGELSAIRAALTVIPPDRLVLGTDYPQELRGTEAVRGQIDAVRGLDQHIAEGVLGGNATRELGLSGGCLDPVQAADASGASSKDW